MKISLPGLKRRTADRSSGAPRERPVLEIQYHPGDIRRKVRYFFLTRRQVRWWVLAGVVYALFLVVALAMVPRLASSLWQRHQYEAEVVERLKLGERLDGKLERLAVLEEESQQVGLKMAKIYLAYGFRYEELAGQGGYPFQTAEVPVSIFSSKIRRGNGLQTRIGEQMAVLDVFLREVQTFEEAHLGQVATTPSIFPLRGESFVLTSPFGRRRNPFTKGIQNHSGIDLAAPVGTPIHATADGVVTFAGWYSLKQSAAWWRYGKLVAINNGERFISIFGHCHEIKVKRGQRVKQGDLIATVGNTGWSTSPHLHYEVRRLDDSGAFQPVDPRIYILDHRWRDEERLLVQARNAPNAIDFEPLPRLIAR